MELDDIGAHFVVVGISCKNGVAAVTMVRSVLPRLCMVLSDEPCFRPSRIR